MRSPFKIKPKLQGTPEVYYEIWGPRYDSTRMTYWDSRPTRREAEAYRWTLFAAMRTGISQAGKILEKATYETLR